MALARKACSSCSFATIAQFALRASHGSVVTTCMLRGDLERIEVLKGVACCKEYVANIVSQIMSVGHHFNIGNPFLITGVSAVSGCQ